MHLMNTSCAGKKTAMSLPQTGTHWINFSGYRCAMRNFGDLNVIKYVEAMVIVLVATVLPGFMLAAQW